jgi:hypothetical protein
MGTAAKRRWYELADDRAENKQFHRSPLRISARIGSWLKVYVPRNGYFVLENCDTIVFVSWTCLILLIFSSTSL